MAPFRIARPRFLAYFLSELGLILGVVAALAQATLLIAAPADRPQTLGPVLAISSLFCAVLFATQWVRLGDDADPYREVAVFGLVSVILGLGIFSALWLSLENGQRQLPGLLVLECAVAVPLVIGLWRWLSLRLHLFDGVRERLLIVGTGETAREVCRLIVTDHGAEYGVLGFADTDDRRIGTILAMGARIQTDFESLPRFCQGRVDRVIVALDEKRGTLPVRPLMELRLLGVEVEESTSFFERIAGKIAVDMMLPSWLIFSEGFKATRMRLTLKRSADIALALSLLVVTAPLTLLTALAIALDSHGPVLYRQRRLGRDGQEYELLKFRSMRQGAEDDTGPTWTRVQDPRITRVGSIIRKLRVNELPQLINVLRGEMSFVGPRPEREHFVRQLELLVPYYSLRMTGRPGITGWAQVEHGYADSTDDAVEKLKYDLYYIKNCNLLLDLWIVCKTFKVVLFGKGR